MIERLLYVLNARKALKREASEKEINKKHEQIFDNYQTGGCSCLNCSFNNGKKCKLGNVEYKLLKDYAKDNLYCKNKLRQKCSFYIMSDITKKAIERYENNANVCNKKIKK